MIITKIHGADNYLLLPTLSAEHGELPYNGGNGPCAEARYCDDQKLDLVSIVCRGGQLFASAGAVLDSPTDLRGYAEAALKLGVAPPVPLPLELLPAHWLNKHRTDDLIFGESVMSCYAGEPGACWWIAGVASRLPKWLVLNLASRIRNPREVLIALSSDNDDWRFRSFEEVIDKELLPPLVSDEEMEAEILRYPAWMITRFGKNFYIAVRKWGMRRTAEAIVRRFVEEADRKPDMTGRDQTCLGVPTCPVYGRCLLKDDGDRDAEIARFLSQLNLATDSRYPYTAIVAAIESHKEDIWTDSGWNPESVSRFIRTAYRLDEYVFTGCPSLLSHPYFLRESVRDEELDGVDVNVLTLYDYVKSGCQGEVPKLKQLRSYRSELAGALIEVLMARTLTPASKGKLFMTVFRGWKEWKSVLHRHSWTRTANVRKRTIVLDGDTLQSIFRGGHLIKAANMATFLRDHGLAVTTEDESVRASVRGRLVNASLTRSGRYVACREGLELWIEWLS